MSFLCTQRGTDASEHVTKEVDLSEDVTVRLRVATCFRHKGTLASEV